MSEPRSGLLLCPDWSVVAAASEAGVSLHLPIAMISGPSGRVLACSPQARAQGVRTGQRRRLAQLRAPDLVVLAPDEDRDARLYEEIIAAAAEKAARVQPLHPGVLAFPLEGPSQYFGSELAAVRNILSHVTDTTGHEVTLGVADTLFAGLIAARHSARVPPGATRDFLAPLDIRELNRDEVPAWSGREELVDLLIRLGLRTLGSFAGLDPKDVANRFGPEALLAHRQARGLPGIRRSSRRPPVPLAVERELDPPADRVDTAVFAAKSLAEDFLQLLAAQSAICTQLRIEGFADDGRGSSRVWRHDSRLTAKDIADRTRWQLDGWLGSIASARRGAAGRGMDGEASSEAEQPGRTVLVRLRLEAEEIGEHGELQRSIWDGKEDDDEQVLRTISRVQGLIGAGRVVGGSLQGGRGPSEAGCWVPWQQAARQTLAPGNGHSGKTRDGAAPWPGRLPAPHPILLGPEPVRLLDRRLAPLLVTIGAGPSDDPAWLARESTGERLAIAEWSGIWPLETRWWDPGCARRQARLQVTVETGEAFLLCCEDGRWRIEGSYE